MRSLMNLQQAISDLHGYGSTWIEAVPITKTVGNWLGGDERLEAKGEEPIRCDLCGQPMLGIQCKLRCSNCGYIRDCSDP